MCALRRLGGKARYHCHFPTYQNCMTECISCVVGMARQGYRKASRLHGAKRSGPAKRHPLGSSQGVQLPISPESGCLSVDKFSSPDRYEFIMLSHYCCIVALPAIYQDSSIQVEFVMYYRTKSYCRKCR